VVYVKSRPTFILVPKAGTSEAFRLACLALALALGPAPAHLKVSSPNTISSFWNLSRPTSFSLMLFASGLVPKSLDAWVLNKNNIIYPDEKNDGGVEYLSFAKVP
jgi:hypothetical protein